MAKAYRPVPIPAGVEVKILPDKVSVKGKLGTLSVALPAGVNIKTAAGSFSAEADPGIARAFVGTTRAHVVNAFTGVSQGFVKQLEVRGMGYRVQKTKEGIQILCGLSHPVDIAAPAGITFDVGQAPDPDDAKIQMSEITVRGMDRRLVGEIAAEIRAIKPPDNYLGKGIRYRAERVVKKQGKRAAGTQA
jgi:large subunit ribosomal protein L6